MSPSLVALAGVSVVMCVMALLVGILFALRAVSRRSKGVPEPVPAADEVTPELVAVLAAAAQAALGKSVVVRRINVLRQPGLENWSRVGRIDILRSHRLDPKR